MPRGVTPAGVRAGEPSALAGLVELRGSAVCAYAGAIAQREDAISAAVEAMAAFRAHAVAAADLRSLDPDAILLRAVRESSATRVRRPALPGPGLRRLTRRGSGVCELVPRLLAARASRELSHADAVRLDRHLAGCPGCRGLRERFRAAERLYAEAAGSPLAEQDARALLLALARAAPLAAGTPQAIAEEALALLGADTVTRPDRPPEPEPSTAPPPDDAAAAQPEPDPPPDDAPSPDRDTATPPPPSARRGARFGTAPGRVSFGQGPLTIRSDRERSGDQGAEPPGGSPPEPEAKADPAPPPEPEAMPAAPFAPEPELGVEAEPAVAPPAAAALEPAVDPLAESPPAHHRQPAWLGPGSNGGRVEAPLAVPSAVAHASGAVAASDEEAPGAPPDNGALARVVPGVLIVMAIVVALVVAGIVGAGTPATSDDTEPSGLRRPAGELEFTGTPSTPSTSGAQAPATGTN